MADFIEKQISHFIDSQFPSFYKEEGPIFIEFVKEYYKWMESNSNPIYHARRYFDYTDVDETTEDFLVYFKEKYLKNIQFDTNTNTRQLIKHALDIFRSKGSERSIDLLFRLVFGVGVEVYYPSTDIMKLSDGKWLKPKYLEISLNDAVVNFVGKQIVGVVSGATAYCERVVRRTINGRISDLIYISNIYGEFRAGEKINLKNDPILVRDCPTFLGSLNSVEINIFGTGIDFSVGQVVNVSSLYGSDAKGRVANVSDIVGAISFDLINGGYAYSNNATVLISDTVLTLSNVRFVNNAVDTDNYFTLFENIRQPSGYINYVNSNGSFTSNTNIYSYHANNDVRGIGTIISTAAINSTAGIINFIVNQGNLNSNAIYSSSNTVGANLAVSNGYVDATYSANIMAESANITLKVTDYVSSFTNAEIIYQIEPISNIEVANGTFIGSNNVAGANADIMLEDIQGVFRNNLRIYGRTSNHSANVESVSLQVGVINASGEITNSLFNIITTDGNNITGTISKKTEGLNASFTLSSDLLYSETVNLCTDYLYDYLNVELGANTYGLPGNLSANLSSYISGSLTYEPVEIGKLYAFLSINPGSDYNEIPFVRVFEPRTYSYGKKDSILYISNLSSNFTTGELITQEDTGARGIIKSGSNSSVFFIERLNFYDGDTFIPTVNSTTRIVGFNSGSTANVTAQYTDEGTEKLGFNAVVDSELIGGNGAITKLEIVDSGFGFMDGEDVTIEGNVFIGTGRANVYTHGTGSGFYQQKGGFLSDQKKLFDGYYYQNFSYEIRSSIALNKYIDMLKKILHVSGSQHFGRFVYNSEANVSVNILNSDITIESI